jgi:hypothetical protein
VQAYLAGYDDIEFRDGTEVLGGVERLPDWVREEIEIRFVRAKNGLTEKMVMHSETGVPITMYYRPGALMPVVMKRAEICAAMRPSSSRGYRDHLDTVDAVSGARIGLAAASTGDRMGLRKVKICGTHVPHMGAFAEFFFDGADSAFRAEFKRIQTRAWSTQTDRCRPRRYT